MKLGKKIIVAALVSVLLLSLTCSLLFVNLAKASPLDRQYLPELTIKSDGSISVPQASDLITRTGNVYTLTANIENYSVNIDRSNIVFDGAGHTINALRGFANSGLAILQATNVTVKNLIIIGEQQTSLFIASSKCYIANVTVQKDIRVNGEANIITQSDMKRLILWRGGSNFISKCNISALYIAYWSGSNEFSANSFLFNYTDDESFSINTVNFWDNGSVGNYWSNYTVKYPNASELGNSGIGDTAYVIDQNNIDHYPLTYPYDVEKDEIVKSTQEPETPSSFTPVIAGVSMVTAIGITSTVIYHRKYRK
ncbi:MAG: hypothetical protein ACQCN5_01485 [Candidatus Bathyarchaeia archaeon]|jgi:hypothetical protein